MSFRFCFVFLCILLCVFCCWSSLQYRVIFVLFGIVIDICCGVMCVCRRRRIEKTSVGAEAADVSAAVAAHSRTWFARRIARRLTTCTLLDYRCSSSECNVCFLVCRRRANCGRTMSWLRWAANWIHCGAMVTTKRLSRVWHGCRCVAGLLDGVVELKSDVVPCVCMCVRV